MPCFTSFFVRSVIPVAILGGLLTACSFRDQLKPPPPGVTKDRAFITYDPPPPGDGRLRLAVKDLIDLKGEVTTAGSEHYAKEGVRATKDAACMAIARERGVVIVGKTNLAEFAMGTSGVNRYFGTPRNPLKGGRRQVPGGSSSGSAVAVAKGAADVAFGTDTAGSVRVPAACCGIYGLKTTYGLVSLKGVRPLSPKNLDTVGPMAANVENLVRGMDLLERGFMGKYQQEMARRPSAATLRIGRLRLQGTDAGVDQAIDAALQRAGFKIVELGEAFAKRWDQAHKDGNTIAVVDGWLTNKEFANQDDVSSLVKAALLLGDIDYPRAFDDARERRNEWLLELRSVFAKVDLIALPTLQSLPPKIPLSGGSPLLEALMLSKQNTVAVNYAKIPAIAIPVPMQKGNIPASLQLVGPRLSEARLLNAARFVNSKAR